MERADGASRACACLLHRLMWLLEVELRHVGNGARSDRRRVGTGKRVFIFHQAESPEEAGRGRATSGRRRSEVLSGKSERSLAEVVVHLRIPHSLAVHRLVGQSVHVDAEVRLDTKVKAREILDSNVLSRMGLEESSAGIEDHGNIVLTGDWDGNGNDGNAVVAAL